MTALELLEKMRGEHAKGWHRGEYMCNCEHAEDRLVLKVLTERLHADIASFEISGVA